MHKEKSTISLIKEQKILPLYFHNDAEVSIGVMKAVFASGMRTLEYTNRGEAALGNFKQMVKTRDKLFPDMQLGVGTIKTNKEAKAFIKAGADFIVSPGIVPSVGEIVKKERLLWIPGCMTATELMLAEGCGATMVKLFPGSLLGPSFVTSIKNIFPRLSFVVTGGVEMNRENLGAWFRAGVTAVGIGSKLVSKELLENKNYEEITQLSKQALGMAMSINGF